MNQSPQQQQQQRRKFQKFAKNSENLPKICRKFLKKKVFFEALISYRYRIVSRKKPNIVSSQKKLIAQGCPESVNVTYCGPFEWHLENWIQRKLVLKWNRDQISKYISKNIFNIFQLNGNATLIGCKESSSSNVQEHKY